MKAPKRSKWFSPMWMRVAKYQWAFRHAPWVWLLTPAKMKAYDRAWYQWRTMDGSYPLQPQLKDFA